MIIELFIKPCDTVSVGRNGIDEGYHICKLMPEGHSRWTIRLLEDEMKPIMDELISREAIRRT